MNKISAVILDWAGTTVDYGSFAPMDAFIAAFEAFGINPGIEEIRVHMGLPKKKHIEKILENKRLAAHWREKHRSSHTQNDADQIYKHFEKHLFNVLAVHAEPLPGVTESVRQIRKMGIAVGSTTGYTRAMMDVIVPLAKDKGYAPDCIICPDDTGGIGRPYPYMLWRNLEKLGISSIRNVLKVGDTAADIEEGKNAGVLAVGVIAGSNMLGLTETEAVEADDARRGELCEEARNKYMAAGADYVIKDISALPELIEFLNNEKGGTFHV
jgi:phosphonoacetaldehyde hydrolase